jgi:hypothetical protein
MTRGAALVAILMASAGAAGPANFDIEIRVVDEAGHPYRRCLVDLYGGGTELKLLSRGWQEPRSDKGGGGIHVSAACLGPDYHYSLSIACIDSREQQTVQVGACPQDLHVDLGSLTLSSRGPEHDPPK